MLRSAAFAAVLVSLTTALPQDQVFRPFNENPNRYTRPVPTPTPDLYPTYSKPGNATRPGSYPTSSPSSTNPCAKVAGLAASFSQTASAGAVPTIPAEVAYQCLNDIPFKKGPAAALLESFDPYIDWQTTIQYLKNPPAEYAAKVQAPYDFEAALSSIKSKVDSNSYKSEYEFGFDVYRLFQRSHDGHFVYYIDSVASLLTFGRQTPLVSVSKDGTSTPEIYLYTDVLEASNNTGHNSGFTPSPITKIGNQDIIQYLLDFSQYGSLQDPDALWNNIFWSPAQVSLGSSGTGTGTFSGGGRGRFIYPGPNTTLVFANGTTLTTDNFARVLQDFTGIKSGEDVYNKFLVPSDQPGYAPQLATQTSSSTSAPTSTPTPSSIPNPGYPQNPVVKEVNNLNGGYFLEGQGYDDVAVLNMASFVGLEADEIPFQNVNTELIQQAVANGKKKLVIDVSANGGGTILQGYDIFKQLFPSILPYGATRFKAHDAFNYIGQEVSAFSQGVPRSLSDNDTTINYISSVFDYHTDADNDYHPFTSWKEKYNPHRYGPESELYTGIFRWNLSDVLTPVNSGGIVVSGYGNRSNITHQPFAAENIVVVYDGYCASTCTIFSELMRQQGGVKTIALGGRPTNAQSLIQAVGGVKGTNDFTWDSILAFAEWPFILHQLRSAADYAKTALAKYGDLPLYRATNFVANVRDGLRKGDQAETPLQFVYEEADCRILYTAEMVLEQEEVWKAAADSAWNGKSRCVAGGLGHTAPPYYGGEKRGDESRARSVDVAMHMAAVQDVSIGQGMGRGAGGDGRMIV